MCWKRDLIDGLFACLIIGFGGFEGLGIWLGILRLWGFG